MSGSAERSPPHRHIDGVMPCSSPQANQHFNHLMKAYADANPSVYYLVRALMTGWLQSRVTARARELEHMARPWTVIHQRVAGADECPSLSLPLHSR